MKTIRITNMRLKSNKMKRTIIYSICLMSLFSACQKQDSVETDKNCSIYLSAGTVETRSPFEGTVPSEQEALDALVCVSTTEFSFPSDGADGTTDGTIGKHLNVQFQSGSSQLVNGAYYNKNSIRNVYFIAMHPKSGWSFTDNTNVSFEFNGSHDVMFAPHTTGKYLEQTPVLKFEHLLTWIKLEIKAESEDVAEAWGPLQEVSIESRNHISFDINKEFRPEDVGFSNDHSLMFYRKGSDPDEVFPGTGGYTMETTSKDIAYVLCAPVTATEKDEGAYEQNNQNIIRTPEYHINVRSSKRNVRIPIDLKTAANSYFSGNTMGKQFTLSLTFLMGNNIAVSARITDWETGGVGFGKIEE